MRNRRLFLGMLAGNAVGGLGCLLAWGLAKLLSKDAVGVVLYPSLVAIPFAIGLVAAWIWRPLKPRIGATLLHSLSCTLVGVALSFLVLREGAVCLLIVAPILYAGIAAGALLGRVWFQDWNDRMNLGLAPFLLLALAAEPAFRVARPEVVTDEIRIAAPPAKVWPHVCAFPVIPDAPDYWLFQVGLPYPVETTNAGNFVGADRACRFSGVAVFKEKVAEYVPNERLTFDIVEMPADPELLGHLTARRGQFELRDNGDGTTTLIGRTWYTLQVRPAFYFDWWTHDIFSAVHLRVMRHIQHLAESGA